MDKPLVVMLGNSGVVDYSVTESELATINTVVKILRREVFGDKAKTEHTPLRPGGPGGPW